MWLVTRTIKGLVDAQGIVYNGSRSKPGVFIHKDEAEALRRRMSKLYPDETYHVIPLQELKGVAKAVEKHRRATKHIQQLVTHPITSEITGKMHMRLRSAETALGWTQAHVADLRRHNTALNQSLNWALAALVASWVFFIAITFGVLPL